MESSPAAVSIAVSPCRYFHPGSEPLELDSRFWALRDSIVQCELLMLRVLRFHVSFQHPHKVHAGGLATVSGGTSGFCFCTLEAHPPNPPEHVGCVRQSRATAEPQGPRLHVVTSLVASLVLLSELSQAVLISATAFLPARPRPRPGIRVIL